MPDHPPDPDLSGQTLGEFHVLRKLGAGGMGQVYLARQQSLNRPVALKLLRPELVANPTALKRFEAEAHAVAQLTHPNIVGVYALGEAGGRRYMALEYVDGRNLREHLARKGPPDLPVALSVLRQVAAGLQKAHEAGVVHRDIKPENILVTRRVEVKVADFGLARLLAENAPAADLTQSGTTVGTPLYLSPEQAQGKAADHRSDLYSLGVTAYHLLAGEPPFRGVTAVDVALKHVTDAPPPLADRRPDLPPALCELVHRLLAKNPDDRPASAREVLRDLARIREGLGLGAAATQPVATAGRRRRRVPWAAAGAACLLAAAGGAVGYARRHPPPDPPAAAAGLPEVRPPEKLVSPRERDLLAVFGDRRTPPDRWIEAGVELGLLALREGRPADADARFAELEKPPFRGPVMIVHAQQAGKFGRAVAAARRDAADPRESLKLFEAAVTGPFPKLVKADRLPPPVAVLVLYPDLGAAVTDALNRTAAALGQDKLSPPVLEALRTARGGRKE